MKKQLLILCLATTCSWAQTLATNTPPQVYVDGQSDTLGNGAFLNCSTVDDGLLRAVTYQWSKLTGPGTITWTAQQGRMTHVRFSAKGLYTIQCTVSDGQYTASDKITILADVLADIAVRP